jgi:hypothetical protein
MIIITLMDTGRFIDMEIAGIFKEDLLADALLTEHLIILVELSADQQILNCKIAEASM